MELVVLLTLYGGMQMAKQQALSNNKVNLQALPPHIREFVTVSARYLDVRMDGSQQGTFARLEK